VMAVQRDERLLARVIGVLNIAYIESL